MAKVFVVEELVDHEGGKVVAVFSSRELAEKYVKEVLDCRPPIARDVYQFVYRGPDRGHCDGADITEFEVDG